MTNPHVAIYVEGAQKGDKLATWVLEMTSPGNLTRAGQWKRNSFKPGGKVDVDMAPLRDGGKGGALKKSPTLIRDCHSMPICASRRVCSKNKLFGTFSARLIYEAPFF